VRLECEAVFPKKTHDEAKIWSPLLIPSKADMLEAEFPKSGHRSWGKSSAKTKNSKQAFAG
jgi:hypothetical protein